MDLLFCFQKEEEKRQRQEKEQAQMELASQHYRRAIMKYRGILPFVKLISLAKRNWLKAVKHREKAICRHVCVFVSVLCTGIVSTHNGEVSYNS